MSVDVDTTEWIRRVLSGEDIAGTENETMRRSPTAEFLREALGQGPFWVDPAVKLKAVLVLLEDEQRKRTERRATAARL